MGHKLRIIISLLFFPLVFSACEKIDLSGMFVSDLTVNQRFTQSMDWNTQHPFREIIVPGDSYSVFSMSDSHVGETNNLDALLNSAKSTNASAVIMAGDLTTGHAEDYSIFQQHLPNQDSLPTFQIAGNHDLYFNGWQEFYSLFGSSSYFFAIKTPVAADLFICLDTGGGTLGNKQLDWLKDVLKNTRPDYRYCLVFTHNNLFRIRRTMSTNPVVEELNVLLELFTKHKVNTVVTGHDHEKYQKLFGNTMHLSMDALMDEHDNSGYLQIIITNVGLEYSFQNF